MIISCPACDTQFNVDALKLAPNGRKVRCARCGHVWKAGPDGQPVAEEAVAVEETSPAAAKPSTAEAAASSPAESTENVQPEPVIEEPPAGEEPEAGAEAEEQAAETGEAEADEEGEEVQENGAKPVLLAEGDKAKGDNGGVPGSEKAALANLTATREALKSRQKSGGNLTRTLTILLILLFIVVAALAFANKRGLIDLGAISGAREPAEIGVVTSESPKPVEGGHIIEKTE